MTLKFISDHTETPLSQDIVVHSFIKHIGQPHASHLLVCRGQSWLVDCHSEQLGSQITSMDLPLPSRIFHTHIQPEHTREKVNETQSDAGADTCTLAEVAVDVHEALRTLASDRSAYEERIRTTWDQPMDWPHSLGQEPYGVAGSVTMRPPEKPLIVAGTFKTNDIITLDECCHLTFKVIALPGHGGEHASGFLLMLDTKPLALFAGDLMRDHAKLVNVYDLEYAYGLTRLEQLPATLNAAASLGVHTFFPATGQVIHDGPAQARQLATQIENFTTACRWHSDQFVPQPQSTPARVGRWFKHAQGIYQLSQFGNTIVLIDEKGTGLLVDPGPCEFGDDRRAIRFEKDLDALHKHAGLRTIDRVLITHFHGDHIDMTLLLKQRYPDLRVAAWGPVADVILEPEKYPYPCMLPWYNLGGPTRVPCDDRLKLDTSYHWHDVTIRTIHLPGHCYVHAAYLMTFRGMHLAISGDTIQSNGDADALSFIIANDSVPDEFRGQLKGLQVLVREVVDLNLGGHSSFFFNPGPVYEETIRRVEHAQTALKKIVPEGDLHKAFFRPWFPEIELV